MTVQEIMDKQVKLGAEMATALEAAKVLTPATAEFDEAYGRYLGAKAAIAKIPDEIAKAKLAENAEAIKVAASQVGEGISQLVEGLQVADLIGTPVVALRYALDAAGNKIVVFNPVTKIAAKGTKESKGTGRTVIVDAEGNRLSLTKFVLAHATEAEKASPEYKYPHTRVDSKPKFEAFCQEHSLTGFTYETPGKAAEVEAS